MKNTKISRRSFLAASAMSAASLSLAACSGSQTSESSSSSSVSSTESQVTQTVGTEELAQITYPLETNGETLTFWAPITSTCTKYVSNIADLDVFKEVAAKSGVEVEFIHPAVGQESEQLGLLIAGGDWPDIIWIGENYSGGSSAGVSDGVFLEMTDLMYTCAPDYYKAILSSDITYKLATTNTGAVTEVSMLKASAPPFLRLLCLDDVAETYAPDGMPVTLDDFGIMFEKMAKDGLPGLLIDADGLSETFMWPYGIAPDFYLDENLKVQYGQAQPAFKEYLTLMNDWYSKGYISKEFITNISGTDRKAMFMQKQFAFVYVSVDVYYNLAKADGKDISVANYPRLEEGQHIPFCPVSTDLLPVYAESTVITTSCKNPELAAKYLNFFYTEEGANLLNWGIEGVTYTVNDAGEKEYTDTMVNNPDVPISDVQDTMKMHLFPKLSEADVDNSPSILSSPESLAWRMLYSDDPTVDNSQDLPDFQLDMDAAAEREDIMRDISTYVEEMTVKFIMGATPLSEFDDYLATLEKLKIAEAVAITQEQYDLTMDKEVPIL